MSQSSKKKLNLSRKHKSKYETIIDDFLKTTGTRYEYEPFAITYVVPVASRKYTPDFILETGIIVEAKGYFDAEDRKKHLLIKEQHPQLDIRFLFYRNQKLHKKSKMRYSDWCDKHGFYYAIGTEPPIDWYTP